jgi:hypothetical protein
MKFLKWRKMTWAILAWSGICLVWIIAGTSSSPASSCATDPDVINGVMSRHACETASNVGTGIGVTLVAGLWFVGFLILSLVWFMTKPRQQEVIVVKEVIREVAQQ